MSIVSIGGYELTKLTKLIRFITTVEVHQNYISYKS